MADKALDQKEDQKPEAQKGSGPKASETDKNVVEGKSAGKDEGGEKAADGAKAPEGSKKGTEKAGSSAKYSLETFLHIHPTAFDQTYAFSKWAEREVDSEQTLEQWEKLQQDFLNRPV